MQIDGLIKRLIPTFLTSQTGQQIFTCNQDMKFGMLIKYNVRNIFLQKYCKKWGRETSSRPIFVFVFLKASYKVKTSCPHLIFNILVDLHLDIQWNKLYNIYIYIYRYAQFLFFTKWSGTSFSTSFFSCYILLTDQISLFGCLYFLRYWTSCTHIVTIVIHIL